MFTLTIYFIVLNVYVEFVLIYRPHPVYEEKSIQVGKEVNKHPHNTLDSLRGKISEVMANMDREVFICSYKKFRSRTEAVVYASGDFIK